MNVQNLNTFGLYSPPLLFLSPLTCLKIPSPTLPTRLLLMTPGGRVTSTSAFNNVMGGRL
jgi:hypothetical protein